VKVILTRNHSSKIQTTGGYQSFIKKFLSFDFIEYGTLVTAIKVSFSTAVRTFSEIKILSVHITSPINTRLSSTILTITA